MSATPLRAPFTLVHHEPDRRDDLASAISIGLSESSSSAVAWRLRVDALTSGGRARLGIIQTVPPNGKRLGARIVALASCPGAFGWDIKVRPIAPYPANVGGFLKIESCREGAGLGLIPADGGIVLTGPDGAGAYNHDAAAAAGATVVPAGARVDGWSLIAGAAPATLVITSPIFGALPTITVPTGASFGDGPRGLGGPVTFTFGGAVASRWVSWLELVE